MPRTYFIETVGCQMNVHDSERMAGLLEQAGYRPAPTPESADLLVLNTCSVREKAEQKLFSRLGELRPSRGAASLGQVVAVAGCVAQQEGEAIVKRAPHVAVVIGTRAQSRLVPLAEAARHKPGRQVDIRPHDSVRFPLGIVRRSDPVKAYVTIMEGCNDACTFCVVPHTRGRERMRARADILAEVAEAAASGRREVHLLGQIVNHYRAPDDPTCDFAGLLEAVHGLDGIERLRFASPHPRHFTRGFIETMRRLPKVCRHLHLPVQSGSTRVLAAMKRRHTRQAYLDLAAGLRDAMPDLALSTDMIVGFPGETDADFEETLSLVREVRFHAMYSFKYSPRPHTLAARRLTDDVPAAEKGRRLTALQQVQRQIQIELNQAAVGRVLEVLVDSVSRRSNVELAGRTPQNTVVNLPGPPAWIGRLVPVRVGRAGPNSLWGEGVGLDTESAARLG